jgi:uncharacterized protein (DUF1499 family)
MGIVRGDKDGAEMTLLAMILGLFLPACGQPGAAGVMPAPSDLLAHLERPSSPNSALAAPPGFTPAPDIVLAPFPVPAAQLAAALDAVAASRPRVYPLAQDAAHGTTQWVARSAVLNFPDRIIAEVSPDGLNASKLVLYSQSLYGYSDFGVNRARLADWIKALDTRLGRSKE